MIGKANWLTAVGLTTLLAFVFTSSALSQQPATPPQNKPTPNPKPSSKQKDDDDEQPSAVENLLANSRVEAEKQLNEKGPQVSASVTSGLFSMGVFIQAGWKTVVEYRVEENAVAQIEIWRLDDKGFRRRMFDLDGVDSGNGVRRAVVTIPSEFGERQPGNMALTAYKKDERGKKQRARFDLCSIGVGVPEDFPGLYSAKNKSTDRNLKFINAAFQPIGPSLINTSDISITPGLLDTALGQSIEYRFVSPGDFGQWTAYFNVVNNKNGETEIRRVTQKQFNAAISRGSEISGDWNGKNSKGKVKKGQYKIFVTAWVSATSPGLGGSCVLKSDNGFTVQ